jgi:Cwf15/Cwc15 cell cycle control protein
LDRRDGQGTEEELRRRDLRAELEAREREHFDKVRREKGLRTGLLTDSAKAAPAQIADKPAGASSGGASAAAAPAADTPSGQPQSVKETETLVDDELALYDDADDDDDDDEEKSKGSGSGRFVPVWRATWRMVGRTRAEYAVPLICFVNEGVACLSTSFGNELVVSKVCSC